MSNQHPITPSPELVNKWYDEWLNADDLTHLDTRVAILAARWGADQELEACCDHIRDHQWGFVDRPDGTKMHRAVDLKFARRPKPPSLKEQALGALNLMLMFVPPGNQLEQGDTIRRALEALPND